MTHGKAASEVFWRALKALPKKERDEVVKSMLKDREFMKDMFDMIVERCNERWEG